MINQARTIRKVPSFLFPKCTNEEFRILKREKLYPGKIYKSGSDEQFSWEGMQIAAIPSQHNNYAFPCFSCASSIKLTRY